MQTHTITKGVHLLYTGANDKKTYGITVKHIDEESARFRGCQVEYDINDYVIAQCKDWEWLGLTEEGITNIRKQIASLC